MHRLTDPQKAEADPQIDAALAQLIQSGNLDWDLMQILDIAIGITGADMGTLQRFDDRDDCLKLTTSRGFSSQVLDFFDVVRRDTHSTCAAAFTWRMRVFVEDIAASYLFVGTRELDLLGAEGVAAVQSTPLISSSGRLWGVITTHFRKPQIESAFDHSPLDRFAVRIADGLEQRARLMADRHDSERSDRES